jgi:putative DNA primase/helicase
MYEPVANGLASLRGARFVSAAEGESQRRMAESVVKQVTGGDPITARFLFKEFFTYLPQFKLFLATNHKPIIRGTDHAIWRRVRLIPFTVTIPPEQQDRDLPDKLAEERAGILRWMVDGCMLWQHEGLGMPEEIQKATESYRAEMDAVGEFLEEKTLKDEAATTPVKTLYGAYAAWCQESGERAVSKKAFGLNLGRRGLVSDRTKTLRFWSGIRLVDNGYHPEQKSEYTSGMREPGDEEPGF